MATTFVKSIVSGRNLGMRYIFKFSWTLLNDASPQIKKIEFLYIILFLEIVFFLQIHSS